MNASLMKKIPLVLATVLCSANLFAAAKDTKDCCPKESDGCCSVELATGRMGCTLQQDRALVNLCHGLELGVSALYWKPYIDGTEYAYTSKGLAGSSQEAPITGSLEVAKTSMAWGFQFSGGYLFCQDGWQIDALFTYHQGKGKDNFSNTAGDWDRYIVPTSAATGLSIGDADYTFSGASTRLSSDFYRLGLILSRGSFVSRLLSISPGLGLNTTWLKIQQDSEFNDATYNTYLEERESKSWQIGPTASLSTVLHFGSTGFSFVGESDLTIGFGNTKVSQSSYYNDPEYVYMNNNRITIAPNAHVLLGIQYERHYFEATQHLKVFAGLDTFVMWDGYRTISTLNSQGPVIQFDQKDGNLFGLVGLTINLTYQF
jgi:hypothetical protein